MTGQLTPRQQEVVLLMAGGKTYQEIGIILGISWSTVKTIAARAKENLDVYKDTALVAAAFRQGIIT